MTKKIQQKCLAGSLALALCGSLTSAAFAQPDPNNAPKAENPPNRTRAARPVRPNMANMTPEQRQAAMAQVREQTVRRLLERSGFAEKALQDDVIAFIKEEDKLRLPLREENRKVAEALRNQGGTEDEIRTALTNLRTAVDKEKTRRAEATKAFAAKANLAQKPRLEALLTMLGIIGDEAAIIGAGAGAGAMAGGMGGLRAGRGAGMRGGAQAGQPGAAGARANRANRANRLNRRNRGNQAAPAPAAPAAGAQ